MTQLILARERPGLLVSVRNAAEALLALGGAADVIDVKEPNLGSLGAADAATIADVVRVVDGRATVTAALGELIDFGNMSNGNSCCALPSGVSLFKIGLARCAPLDDWKVRWKHVIDRIRSVSSARPVAVAYADWRAAQSPPPGEVLDAAVEHACPALLIDTWNKSTGSLFDHWPADALRRFLSAARARDLAVVLAGSLTSANIVTAARLVPDLIAVRAAACNSGRGGTVSGNRVRELKRTIAEAIGATDAAQPI